MGLLSSISNIAIQFQTTRLMQAGREKMYNLQAQVASGKLTSDLSTLSATSTRELLSSRSGQTKFDNYILAIKTVDTRLKVQSQSLGDMQDIAEKVASMINTQQSSEAATAAGASGQYESFLMQIQVMLNQRLENRFIFSGSRYTTEPVRDLNSLPVPPTEAYPFSATTSPALPIYDRDYINQSHVGSIVADSGASTLTLGSSTWAAQGYVVGDVITVNGVRGIADGTEFTITGLNNGIATVTPAPNSTGTAFSEAQAGTIAGDLSDGTLTLGTGTWADRGVQAGDTITLTGTAQDGTYEIVSINNGIAVVNPAPGADFAADNDFDVAVEYTGADTAFSLVRNADTSTAGAYHEEAVYIDDGLLNPYGVTSTDPAFQNLIQGIRWAYAATQDPSNYETYMVRADELIGSAKTQIRILEAKTAADQGLFADKLSSHKETLTDLKNRESGVIDADVSDAATQLSILAAQMQASYAATGRIIQLSIVNYI